MRKDFLIPGRKELHIIELLSSAVMDRGFNSSNTIVVTVSPDYSAILGQLLRHNLSFEGEIAEGFAVDVPYPDETWEDKEYLSHLDALFALYSGIFKDKTLLLVEAGIIRGGNYKFLTEWITKNYPTAKVKTLALFQNIHSKFQSDFVGEFYDNEFEDLTFWWEKENNHFK
jgi:hypothetical protein